MRVLIACEESQSECKAFRAQGYEAYSCDIQECSGGHPEWHIKDDVTKILYDNWDLVIAHPPCTYLSNAGARWLYPKGKLNKERYEQGLKAKQFFMLFYNYKNSPIAIENPMPSKIYDLPDHTQIIQPWEFGHPVTKRTYLWLHGLPYLEPTNPVKPEHPFISTGGIAWESRKGGSSKMRSKSFDGVSKAMAEQWGRYVEYYTMKRKFI